MLHHREIHLCSSNLTSRERAINEHGGNKVDVIKLIRQTLEEPKPYLIHKLLDYLYYSSMGRFVMFHEKL